MRIAIDAMGGDNAPWAITEGVLLAAKEWPDAELILVGDETKLQPITVNCPTNVKLHHASEIILSDDEPVKAVRRKKDSSMVVAARLVREGEADAMISAGNTGALMTAGLLVVGRIPGIERPALAPMIPTLDGSGTLALDLGANMDATPEQLLQYAIMGSIYRAQVDGIPRPRVGLLNVGTEDSKGNELTKAAFRLMKEAPIHFVGNIEARNVLHGECDVLVCDGFAGNILLKSVEGTASAIFKVLKEEFKRNLFTKAAAVALAPGLKNFKKRLDYSETGGAPMLGLNGLVLKAHGSSDANAMMNAVRQARIAIEGKLVPSITAEIGVSETKER